MFRSVKKNLIAMIILTMLGGFAVSVNAAFNEQINFQGKLTNSSNLSVADGNNCMKFSLYTASAGGSSIWSEEWKASTSYIVTTSGLFSVLLGSNTVLSSVNFNQSALYLQVEYDPACDGTYEESFSPRKLFGAVPAAFEAKKLAGYTWATPDAIGTSTPSTGAFTTLFAGIGAINPLAKLHVEGQCVTGDTKLRRRRRKLKTTTQDLKPNETEDENYIYDYVMIKDVKPGDEIQTLDENTGKLVWSKVNALMDMGVKQIYKLTTASGKTIRTTGNHPYLVNVKPTKVGKIEIKQRGTIFEVDQSNRIEELNRDRFISIADKDLAYTIKLSAKDKKALYDDYKQRRKNRRFVGWHIFAKAVATAVNLSGFRVTDLVVDFEYPGYEQAITGLLKQLLPRTEVSFKSIGKHSPAHQAAWQANKGSAKVQGIITSEQIKKAETQRAEELL